jgi:cytoskeleton protein RodZ
MADEINANSLKQDNHFEPLGEILLGAREAKKLSQNDVSNTLRISVKQISALERNAFEELPESAITRGFIRNYARLLGIEAEPLLTSHRTRIPDNEPASLSVKTTTRHVMSKGHQNFKVKYLSVFFSVLCLLGLWFLYSNYLRQVNVKSVTANENSSTTSVMPEVALPAAERQNVADEQALPTQVSASETTVSNPSQSATQTHEMPAQQALVVANTTAAVSATVADAAMPNNKVSMKFTAETWVRAKNQSGKVIFEKTFTAGDVGGFDAEPPITVTIGNAKATQLQYLGQSVDLTAVTAGNVARVKLP